MIATAASQSYVHYQPIGPVLAVMPWNFPMWQVIRFAAPALMVGNVGLLKHASNVPQTALALEDLFRRAGLPEGVFTNLFVDSKDVAALIADPRMAAVTLTGSERAGMSVALGRRARAEEERARARRFGPLHRAGLGRPRAVRAHRGDRPGAEQRAVVHRGQAVHRRGRGADEFLARFTEAMDALVVGDPFDPATDVGPIVTEAQRDELVNQVEEAVRQGATVHAGATVPDGDGWYFAPTVLSGITSDMPVAQEELFGPVALVMRVPDLDAAIDGGQRHHVRAGLERLDRRRGEIARCIEEIEAGQVFVNAMVVSTPELPFGGIKRSGYGRELSELGFKEFTNAKTVWIA